MKRKWLYTSIIMAMITTLTSPLVALASDKNDDYLHTDGSKIYDSENNEVRLTGIAWFGNETPNYSFHGLWANRIDNLVNIVADNGFNTLRVPLSVELVNQWRQGTYPMPDSINDYISPELKDKNSLEILDMVVAQCKKVGVKVMLDMHRIQSASQTNTWYTGEFTTDDYEQSWTFLAEHFKDDDTVIAADLFNEPHGKAYRKELTAKWDNSEDENNWKYEAEKVGKAILDINPNLLVVVEGVETYPKEGATYASEGEHNYYGTWWGGNLRGVKDYPVDLGKYKNKIVYSPHDYGPAVSTQPWFEKEFDKESLTNDVWTPNWFYIQKEGIAPLLIGEWGGFLNGGDNERWLRYLADFIKENNINHTFWCLNPNSGDTGGLLDYDFSTIDQEKLKLVQPTLWQTESGQFIGLDHQVNLGATGTHVKALENGSTNSDDNKETNDNENKDSEDVVLGDVNGDNQVNNVDFILLKKYLMNNEIKINTTNSDVNKDGKINIMDLTTLKKLL